MITLFLLALLPQTAYQGLDTGARPLAMGYAVTSTVLDPALVFFNPAGISLMPEPNFAVHYTADRLDFGDLGKISAVSLVMPEVSLTYHSMTNVKTMSQYSAGSQQISTDERYKLEEYVATITSKTANPSFTSNESFLVGLNFKYLRGQYFKIDRNTNDSLLSYVLSDGGGYGFDAGCLLRFRYFVLGVLLKDIYSRMKWLEVPEAEVDKIKFIPRVGTSINTDPVLISFDIQKAKETSYHLGGELRIGARGFGIKPRCGVVFMDGEVDYYTLGLGLSLKDIAVDFGVDLDSKRNAFSFSFPL